MPRNRQLARSCTSPVLSDGATRQAVRAGTDAAVSPYRGQTCAHYIHVVSSLSHASCQEAQPKVMSERFDQES